MCDSALEAQAQYKRVDPHGGDIERDQCGPRQSGGSHAYWLRS